MLYIRLYVILGSLKMDPNIIDIGPYSPNALYLGLHYHQY